MGGKVNKQSSVNISLTYKTENSYTPPAISDSKNTKTLKRTEA